MTPQPAWEEEFRKIHDDLTDFHLRECEEEDFDKSAKCLAEKFDIVLRMKSLIIAELQNQKDLTLKEVRDRACKDCKKLI